VKTKGDFGVAPADKDSRREWGEGVLRLGHFQDYSIAEEDEEGAKIWPSPSAPAMLSLIIRPACPERNEGRPTAGCGVVLSFPLRAGISTAVHHSLLYEGGALHWSIVFGITLIRLCFKKLEWGPISVQQKGGPVSKLSGNGNGLQCKCCCLHVHGNGGWSQREESISIPVWMYKNLKL
jgi:hypothetical protein